ncbi:MAG: dihydropteroate synthase [Deltaproteobacteria bacterium]|nr:MAG: dihydropteroate synthase [Deltaproteobacteria bacterium]
MNKASVFHLQCGPFSLSLGKRTLIMGILNVTPDSFSDGGLFFDHEDAIAHGEALAAAGADIIDVGGESSRPFSETVPAEEETRRVVPVIEELAGRLSVPISIDTNKAEVARHAINAGASMVNDIGALRLDPAMAGLVAEVGVPVVLMHMKGTPKSMQIDPHYEDVVEEVKTFLADAIQRAEQAGIDRSKIIVDPGIGFGKTVTHNLLLIRHLSALHALGVPVLIGPSRKSFIAKILGPGDERREVGTQAAVAAAALYGAHIVRTHDVERTRETLKLVDAIKNSVTPDQ